MFNLRKFENTIRRICSQMIAKQPVNRWGNVTSIDPATHSIRATIEPENTVSKMNGGPGVITGWLNMPVPAQGAAALPNTGQQIYLTHEGGDSDHPVAMGVTYNASNPPPKAPSGPPGSAGAAATNAGPGEWLWMANGGGIWRMNPDGTGFMQLTKLMLVGDLLVTGNIIATGDVSDKHGSLDRLRQNYNAHTHSGVQTGTGVSGPTNLIDPE